MPLEAPPFRFQLVGTAQSGDFLSQAKSAYTATWGLRRMRALGGVIALAVAGCAATQVDPPVQRIAFDGLMDLTRPGIHFTVSSEPSLVCEAHHAGSRLPDSLSLQLNCNDEIAGTLSVTKAADVRGAVTLSDNRMGDVIFTRIEPQRIAAAPTPATTGVAPPVSTITATTIHAPQVGRSGPVHVRAHYRRGTSVRGHYRKGKWVSGHSRKGSSVRSYSRRR